MQLPWSRVNAILIHDNQKLLETLNQQSRETFSKNRRAVIRKTAAVWLLPPLALYALGWSVKWVWRGFRAR